MEKRRIGYSQEKYFFMGAPAIIWQSLFFFLPLLFVLVLSFLEPASCKPLFTIANYINILAYAPVKAILTSLLLALLNVFLCLLVAYPMAYCLVFKVRHWQNVLMFFLTLPLWVNFLVQVYAWFFILERNGLVNNVLMKIGLISEPLHLMNNMFSIVLVMFHVYLPFMVMPIYNILEKLDFHLIEAANDLGASWWQTLKTVTLPLSISGIQLGSFLVFVLSFGEFIIPTLLGGEKILFVGPLISQYFLSLPSMSQGAAFTVLSSISLIFTLGFLRFISSRLTKG